MDELFVFGALVFIALLCLGLRSTAYRHGVNDGWGFSHDPGCQSYEAAGEIIRKIDPIGHKQFLKEHQRIVRYTARIPQDVDESFQWPPDLM